MATIKKNQLANMVFPMVDKTDFASIESGITASDFNSAATKKFYGVNHGGSAAYTSGTISKATTLVRSGIFQQTLKASETNYDYLLVRFTHPSAADQLIVLHPNTYDDSDIFSQLSDIGSNLLSYLTGISGAVSDVQSAVALVATSNYLSQVHSDIMSNMDSQFNYTSAALSNTHDDVNVVQSMVSDLDSQVLLNASMISDIQSAVALLATSNYLSQVHSDLYSAIGNVSVTLTASDISDIASAVAEAVGSDISDVYSLVQNVDSQLLLNASMISDVDSQLLLNASAISDIESQLDVTHSLLSDVESAVDGIWTTQLTEAYNADGVAPTAAQALFGILQNLTEFSIAGTTITVKKLDGSTTAMTFTLDDGTNPTSRTRAT